MANYYSSGVGVTPQGVSIDNNRRLYNFGNQIAFLRPEDSLLYAYLSRFGKMPTNDPVFKMLERRLQYQRRQGEVQADKTGVAIANPTTIIDLRLTCKVDNFGRVVTADTAPLWLLVNQNLTIECEINHGAGNKYIKHRMVGRITSVGTATATHVPVTFVIRAIDGDTAYATTYSGKTLRATDGFRFKITGSAFAEGTGAPDGWEDKLFDREGYCQIFKTSVNLVTGTTMSTEYRGIADEWGRIWSQKMPEHRNDIAEAFLFGVGKAENEDGSGDPKRFTWGLLPYVEQFGTVQQWSYGATKYDDFTSHAGTFFDRRKGGSRVKMVFCPTNVINWATKLGPGGILANSLGRENYQIRVETLQSSFFGSPMFGTAVGLHDAIRVITPHGRYVFVEEPLLNEMFEDYAIVVDLPNVKVRPLRGNGRSRDTFVVTNVQGNDIDGRKDMILTETGLWVGLPELHEVWHFN